MRNLEEYGQDMFGGKAQCFIQLQGSDHTFRAENAVDKEVLLRLRERDNQFTGLLPGKPKIEIVNRYTKCNIAFENEVEARQALPILNDIANSVRYQE
jgi:hypothetical protein